MCYSLAGNKVEYIHITGNAPQQAVDNEPQGAGGSSPTKVGKRQKNGGGVNGGAGIQDSKAHAKEAAPVKKLEKRVIMLTSRVHPGETGASWMMHGLIDCLLNPSTDEEKILVKNLKDHFEFYIIPMLNVDGVINGNYRCSLAACDLNRKWTKPSKAMHPPVYYTKKLCQTL